MISFRTACMSGLVFSASISGSAQAASYLWTITGATAFSGSGTFTTEDRPVAPPADVADTNTGPAYLITSFEGIFANKTVKLLAWDPDNGPWYADNLFYPIGHLPYVDLDGILFQTFRANGSVAQTYNMFASVICGAQGCADQALIGYPGIGASKKVTFSFVTVTPLPPLAAVPEPAGWVMLLAGFGIVGSAMRRSISKPAIA